jgi:hypothetical protein
MLSIIKSIFAAHTVCITGAGDAGPNATVSARSVGGKVVDGGPKFIPGTEVFINSNPDTPSFCYYFQSDFKQTTSNCKSDGMRSIIRLQFVHQILDVEVDRRLGNS